MALAISAFALQSCEDVPEPYTIPGQETGGGDNPGGNVTEPTGDGTVATPYNVAAAINVCAELQKSSTSASYLSDEVYVKGKVSSIVDTEFNSQYGNITYYISDMKEDGTTANQLEVYRGYGLNGAKFTGLDDIKVGDEVIVKGKLQNWLGTYEFTQGSSLYSLNGSASGGDQPSGEAKGDGTLENPYNSVAATALASSLASGATSDVVYIKGKIASIKENYTTQYGNASFYISDDGTSTDQFYVFRTLYLNNEKYTGGDVLSVGDEVVICGKVTNYMGNTPETAQGTSYLYSWTKGEGGNTGGNTGDITTTNGDFETWVDGLPNNWKTSSTAGNATLSQSTDAHSGTYSVNVGGTSSANKRIGYKEIELKAGSYTMTFYAKAATANGASVRPGFVPVTDGKVGSYVYGNYVNNINNSEWIFVTHTFDIPSDGTYSLVIMNSKSPGADVLIDDFVLETGGNIIIK